MEHPLPGRGEEAAPCVRVHVPGQQGPLEEEEAGVPHRRRATQQREDHLGGHRLHREEQRRVREDEPREEGEKGPGPGGWPGSGRHPGNVGRDRGLREGRIRCLTSAPVRVALG